VFHISFKLINKNNTRRGNFWISYSAMYCEISVFANINKILEVTWPGFFCPEDPFIAA
jgi:hypothetical protein